MHPQEVKKVAIIGAGVMGHSIAQVFAQAGIEVNLVDLQEEILEHALQLVKGNLRTLADHGKVDPQDIPAIVDHIHPHTELAGAAKDADFALEAVAEIPEVKNKVFKELEEACPEKTVLASNTSGLEIFNIARVKDPSRVVVAHWFAPPHIIPLRKLTWR
jgi:3-hydroxyacyl-CoA dehydrogenase